MGGLEIVNSGEIFSFNPSRMHTIKPTLGKVDSSYGLSVEELNTIFGIDPERFGSLPSRMVVPVLTGHHHTESWYRVTGYLYIVEPKAWIAKVSKGKTLPLSEFITKHKKEAVHTTESNFNAGTSAELTIEAGGSYAGISASVKSNSKISFDYSESHTLKDASVTEGESGRIPVHEIMVYPILQCRVIKKQRIDYTINDSSDELKWSPESYNAGYWDRRIIESHRLSEIQDYVLHPVPVNSNGLPWKGYILPIPHLDRNGDFDVTTVMSRQGWKDWYVYDLPWVTPDEEETIDLAAPKNDIAFQPMHTWTTLVSNINVALTCICFC